MQTNLFTSEKKNTCILYHGSKSGIKGDIIPLSRSYCDFGKGFYMGTERLQPLTLICNYPNAKLYKLELNLSGLKIMNMDADLKWALLIAFNRGKMKSVKGTAIYNYFEAIMLDYDLIIGYIANDRMFIVLDRFFKSEITDKALISSLSALKLGRQYVALTLKACKNVSIIEEQVLSEDFKLQLKELSEKNRLKGIALAEECCRKYRREGKFFDEILEEGDYNVFQS